MIAAHGKVQSPRVGIPAASDFSDAAPVDIRRVSILFVAGDDATFAADALRHVEVEAVLFAEFESALRDASGLNEGGRAAVRSLAVGRASGRENKGRALLFGSL